MAKPLGDPVGFAILLGIIIGVGILFCAFAIFYKFVVLGPTERWNQEEGGSYRREPVADGGLPQNPYSNNTVVPVSHGHNAFNDVEMGEVSTFSYHQHPGYLNLTNEEHQHYKPIASAVVPVVEAVLYESDAEPQQNTNNPRRIDVSNVSTTDARAQAMRDWYDS